MCHGWLDQPCLPDMSKARLGKPTVAQASGFYGVICSCGWFDDASSLLKPM
jgi:hypothetical protein